MQVIEGRGINYMTLFCINVSQRPYVMSTVKILPKNSTVKTTHIRH